MIRDLVVGSAFAVIAAFATAPATPAQTAQAPVANPKASAPHVDLSGVWRRSRSAPDKTRKYTIYELAFAISNDVPPMTPWATEKFNANKPNLGPRPFPLASPTIPSSSVFRREFHASI